MLFWHSLLREFINKFDKDGDGVVIVDAGGGTIDVSSYCRNMTGGKESFDEVAASQCETLFVCF